jgi:two-component system, NarL family, sensor histidine kinase UhpB
VPLYWKVFLINGTVLCAATLALVLAPVSVSRQVVVSEVLVLAVGLGVMLLANALVLRSSLAPVDRVIREMRAEQTSSNAKALAAQEAERHRIAQELHDEVGQHLTVVLLGLKQVEQRAPADIAAELALLREATRDGLDDVRRVARQLRPGVLEDLGLTSALASLTNDFAEHSGASVRRVVAPGLPTLSGEAELVLYRVAQEALTNAARHARAGSVTLSLTRVGDRVVLEVADDGHGFDTGREGAGLRGMRERASLVAGALSVSSSPRGTTVRLAVPVVPA